MRYRVIKISPFLDDSHSEWIWGITDYLDPQDREEVKTVPHPNGYYHSPESEDITFAKIKLIDVMVAAHLKRISDLDKSMNMLFDLRCRVVNTTQ